MESTEFWTDIKSFVDTKMAGRATDRSPGHGRRSRFAPSVDTEVPFEIVRLLYQVVMENGELPVISSR